MSDQAAVEATSYDKACQAVGEVVAGRMFSEDELGVGMAVIEALEGRGFGVGPKAEADPEQVAGAFHEAYERLAPDFGYKTREASAKPWAEVPEDNRALMCAVAAELIDAGTVRPKAEAPAGLREWIVEKRRESVESFGLDQSADDLLGDLSRWLDSSQPSETVTQYRAVRETDNGKWVPLCEWLEGPNALRVCESMAARRAQKSDSAVTYVMTRQETPLSYSIPVRVDLDPSEEAKADA